MSVTPVYSDTNWRHGGAGGPSARVSVSARGVTVQYRVEGIEQELVIESVDNARRIAEDILSVTRRG